MSGAGERRGLAVVTYVGFATLGWVVANILLALGVLVVAFVMFANASFEGFFAEAENLARHFGDASSESRAAFIGYFQAWFGAVFLIVSVFRWRVWWAVIERFVRRRAPELIEGTL